MSTEPAASAVPVAADRTLDEDEFRTLAEQTLSAIGVGVVDAEIAARHFLDAELRDRGGIERLELLVAAIAKNGPPTEDIMEITETSATTTLVDGRGRLGYTVAERVTDIAIEKARTGGIAVVAGSNHRYSGVLGHYVERVAREGLIGIASSSASLHLVAPHGSLDPLLSTNPIAIGVPTAGQPIVWDTAMAAIAGTVLERALETGEPLPDGAAIDADGDPTRDPAAARRGAITTWGGHRGSGLAIMIQLLSLLCGVPNPTDWQATFLLIAFDPARFGDAADYLERTNEFAAAVRASRPRPGVDHVRMPSDRAMASLAQRRRSGIRVPSAVLERLGSARAASARGDLLAGES